MWPKVWKIVFALLACLGALFFLLFCTIVILVLVDTREYSNPEDQPQTAAQLQYLVYNCGLQHGEIVNIDKHHQTTYADNNNGDINNSDIGYNVTAYSLKLSKIDSTEFTMLDANNKPRWNQPGNTPLPHLSQVALQYYLAYVNRTKSPKWLPDETQLMSDNYHLSVNQLSFDDGRVTNAGICIFRPADNKLDVITLNHW